MHDSYDLFVYLSMKLSYELTSLASPLQDYAKVDPRLAFWEESSSVTVVGREAVSFSSSNAIELIQM